MKKTIIGCLVATILFCGLSVIALRMLHHRRPYAPTRPLDVPADATYIQGPDGKGDWEWCRLESQSVHCSIRTVGGTVLRDGPFITYRGPIPTRQEDLMITQFSGDSWIALADGTYLIPQTNNEGSKRYLNFMLGNAKSFDK